MVFYKVFTIKNKDLYLFIFQKFTSFFAKFRVEVSERILSTFVKVNRLSFLSESCLASPKLLASKFSSRLG